MLHRRGSNPMPKWLNCWLHLHSHRWGAWEREDTWLNMWPAHIYTDAETPKGILARRCERCIRIKIKEIWQLSAQEGR